MLQMIRKLVKTLEIKVQCVYPHAMFMRRYERGEEYVGSGTRKTQ